MHEDTYDPSRRDNLTRAAFYLRVSTDSQTVENQLLALTEVAQRSGWTIVHIFADEGISGAKGRSQRPGYDALLKAVARKEVQIVAAWSVDRLGRSLSDLVAFLGELQSHQCDLFLHQQALNSTSAHGRMVFGLLSVFSEFERSMIRAKVMSGLERARSKGVRLGRPTIPPIRLKKVEQGLQAGGSIRVVAKATGVSTATVMKVKRSMQTIQADRDETVATA